jgi:MFS transporter, PAT family, beta-lactamase induction signal transducer AmpG
MSPLKKLLLLSSLYLSQGLPFGFFSQAVPVLLRKEGLSLPAIGATSLLALPWALKFLWAPLVDGVQGGHLGRRRAVILPLQAVAVFVALALAFVDPRAGIAVLLAGVLVTNLVAATQDIATDGLAVELLAPKERGLGNAIQVAGYRGGMILGGGALLIVFGRLGWRATFLAMAGILLVATVPIALFKEAPAPPRATGTPLKLAAWLEVARQEGMGRWLLVLVVYKSADAMATAMLRPFLVDLGLTLEHVGTLLGGVGFGAGLLGAVLGGLLVNPLGRRRALVLFGGLQALSVGAYLLPALGLDALWIIGAVAGFEHLCGGMATVTLFTLMMDRSRPESAGTDYTVQASVVGIATGLASALSGVSAGLLGYATHFAACAALGVIAVVVIAHWLYPREAS